jgi:membrane protein YqaA with SNARE-associated domain
MDMNEFLAQFVAWSDSVVASLGYLGIFVVSLVGSASIILPVPVFALVFAAGAVLNPWLVGLSAGAGSALGELTGYALGKGGERVVQKKYRKIFERGRKLFERKQAFAAIVVFAATPLPDDIVGVLCGMFDYDVRKFLIASFAGKTVMNLALAWGGFYGVRWVLTAFGGL